MVDQDQKNGLQGAGAPRNEGTVEFTQAEVADIRAMMAKSVEKDALIEGLSAKVDVLTEDLAKAPKGQTPSATAKPGARKITHWYAKLRKFEGKWVLGWEGGVYNETNVRGGQDQFINVKVKDGDEVKLVKMPFLKYINECPQEMVKIKERRKLEDTVQNSGEVEKVVFDEKTGTMIGLGYSVPVDNVIENYEYVFDLGDGKDTVISSDFVNR